MGKSYSIMELNKDNILSFAYYLPEDRLEEILKENVGALGLVMNEVASCGALLYSLYPREGICLLESICVDSSQRRKGLGRMLFNAFEKIVEKEGLREVDVKLYMPEEYSVKSFLEALGFNQYLERERFYEFSQSNLLEILSHSLKENGKKKGRIIRRISQMSGRRKKIMEEIPYDEKLSFVEMDQKDVCQYILASSDEKGNIIILASQLDMWNEENAVPLVREAIDTYLEALPPDGILYVTAYDEQGAMLVGMLSGKEEYSYSYVLEMAKTISGAPSEEITLKEIHAIIPRIQGLSKILNDLGDKYRHNVYVGEEDAIINLTREEGKLPVSLHYEVTESETASAYTLKILSAIDLKELNARDLDRVRQWQKESAMVSFNEDGVGNLYVHTFLLEREYLTDPEFLKEVLDGFILELDSFSCLEQVLKSQD